MLADIYNWFTEGFDTADLKDAKALLDELGATLIRRCQSLRINPVTPARILVNAGRRSCGRASTRRKYPD